MEVREAKEKGKKKLTKNHSCDLEDQQEADHVGDESISSPSDDSNQPTHKRSTNDESYGPFFDEVGEVGGVGHLVETERFF